MGYTLYIFCNIFLRYLNLYNTKYIICIFGSCIYYIIQLQIYVQNIYKKNRLGVTYVQFTFASNYLMMDLLQVSPNMQLHKFNLIYQDYCDSRYSLYPSVRKYIPAVRKTHFPFGYAFHERNSACDVPHKHKTCYINSEIRYLLLPVACISHVSTQGS